MYLVLCLVEAADRVDPEALPVQSAGLAGQRCYVKARTFCQNSDIASFTTSDGRQFETFAVLESPSA